MTTQAIPAPHVAASIPSIPPCPAIALYDGDVSVTATFRRLTVYRDAYRQAMTGNDQPVMDEDADPTPVRTPLPLPVPWYAW